MYKNIESTMRVDMLTDTDEGEQTSSTYYIKYKCDGDNERAS